jgi:TonB family protein
MKFAFVLFVLLLHSAVFGKDLTVSVIDGWKSKPVVDCEVTLKSQIGQELFVVETDAQGKVTFSGLTYGIYTIVIADLGEDFSGTDYKIKIVDNTEITLILPAKQVYKARQWAIEDSIYEKDELPKKDSLQGAEGEERDSVLQASSSEEIYVEAEFPGGAGGIKRFIQENVIYPEISRELGDQGQVFVSFVVEPDGVVTHVFVRRRLTVELDEEAKRLVRSMPIWTPGSVNGEKVRSRCTLPITFTLQ